MEDQFVEQEMKYWNIPGAAIAVCYKGEIIFEKGYGYRNLTTKEPMTPMTLGAIASCSKSFTSAVLASLVDEGLLDFDRPVVEYIPQFSLMDETATKEVTVRDMLYHRTGLAGHDAMWPDESIDRAEFMHRLRYLKPNKPFRSATQYSNVIYSLLGHIAEEITGQTWEELVQTKIFEPLEMKKSCLTVADMRKTDDYAVGYFERIRGGELEEMPAWEMNVGSPAAGVNSSVHEMMNWLQMHLNGGIFNGKRILSEEVVEEMHRGVVDMDIFPWKYDEICDYGLYGMAWKTIFYRGMPYIFHSGEIEGYCTMEIILPDQELGIMILLNKHKPTAPFLSTMAYTIIDTVLGMPQVDWAARMHEFDGTFGGTHYHWDVNLMPGKPVQGTELSHDITEYTGDFESKAYGKMKVIEEEGELFLLYKTWKLPMEHFHYDTFRIHELKEDTIFVTMPMTYHYDEITGRIDGYYLKLEPAVESIWFQKVES